MPSRQTTTQISTGSRISGSRMTWPSGKPILVTDDAGAATDAELTGVVIVWFARS